METLFPRRNNPFQRFGDRYGHYFGDSEFLGRSPLADYISVAPHTAANISKNAEAYEIEVVAPGFDKEDIELSVHQGILMIKADKKVKHNVQKKEYILHEYNHEMLERSFKLPDNVDADAISARYENGILHLRLPYKPTKVANKQISIQ
ncbi:MAG: Hsp20/alpha crystallin family protein [Cytophagales bacterium]|nr:Hsp20/alpha crystallin family protein [Bernardetiaceae bacterium]MDW8205831.1 Hsp20/alpha crystallin family protein [Cytophagales bacterium]